nr:ribonuclease H-like domain-containing protein [Tanacetum cinerariifolium]
MAFVSLSNNNIINGAVNTAQVVNTANGVSTAGTQVNTVNINNLSDVVICTFLASQSSSPQLVNEDLEQIHPDDLEEMDLKMADDHRGHFAKECRVPRAQDNKNRESTRRNVPVETTNSSALVSCDGLGGYDLSDQVKEGPNYALMAYSTSSFDSEIVDNCKKGLGYNAVPPPYTGLFMPPKPNLSYIGLKEITSEPAVETLNAKTSEDVPKIEEKTVKPSVAKVEFVKPKQYSQNARKTVKNVEKFSQSTNSKRGNQRNRNYMMSQRLGSNYEMYNKACYECGSFNHLQRECNYHNQKVVKPVWNYNQRVNHKNFAKNIHSCPKRNIVLRAVLMKSGIKLVNAARQNISKATVTVNTARPVNTAHPKTTMNAAKSRSYFLNSAHSIVKRPIQSKTTFKNSFINQRFNTVRNKQVNTARPKAVLNAVKGNKVYAVKASACWVWKPKIKILDHVSKHNSALITLKKYDYIDAQGRSKVPRKNNMYSVDLKNIIPKGCLTCLLAKATSDESRLWHRRLGHLNFKTMNKLAKGNLVRGLPSKIYENEQTCVACQNGKQHKASSERRNRTLIEAARTMLADSKLPTTFWAEVVNTTCYVQNKPVVAGTQSNGNACTKDNNNAGQARKEKEPGKDYILLPLWTADPPFLQEPKSSQDVRFKPSNNVKTRVNVANNEVNDVGRKSSIKLPDDPNMPELDVISIFEDSNKDVFGAEADFNNLESTFQVSPVPITRIYKDHPLEQAIGDLHSAPQTRRMNKMDERGIMIRNKARLVAQGHTQEEGIDYDEVFAPVSRIKAIRLFLFYASFQDFIMYQMDVKSDFLYEKIEEEKEDGIFISQNRYVAEILKKSGFFEVKTASTPMESQKHLLKDEDGEEVDVHIYRSMIGSLMYLTSSRFIQTILDKQLDGLPTHKEKYDVSFHTKKVFANMKRIGKGFSGKETPLFPKMVGPNQVQIGEGSTQPNDTQHTPIFNMPPSKPKKTQKPRQPKRNTTKVPQPSESTDIAADEAVYKERVTVSDSLLVGINRPRSDEDSLKHIELMKIYTTLQKKVLNIEDGLKRTKTTQQTKIDGLKRKVKKLKKKYRSRTHKLKRLYKVGLTSRIISPSDDEAFDKEDTSKQGRIDEIDVDDDIVLIRRNMDGWKSRALKNKSFAKIKELFNKAMKRINNFTDFRTELVEKVEDDKESEELKKCLEIIPDDGDDVTIDATPLSSKSPIIADYEIYKERKKNYFQFSERVALLIATNPMGTPAGRVILFGTIPTTIPDTTLMIAPPTADTPIITPTIPPSPDYTPASPDYSPASEAESDPSEDLASGHIPPLLATSPFLSSDDDTTDSDTSDTPPSPTHDTPFTEITAYTQRSSVIPRRRVMILSPGQPIPHGRPYHYHLNGLVHMMTARKRVRPLPMQQLSVRHPVDHSSSDSSSRHSSSDHSSPNLPSTFAGPSRKRRRSPMTSVPALPLVSGALSPLRADLIPPPKRVKDIGYLANVEDDPRETRVERVTHHAMPEDIPEPDQEGEAEGRRIVGVESAVVALTERVAELERDNQRLRGTANVESQRVDRLQHGMKMPNTRSRASMTHKEVEELITRRVAEEREAREVARNLEALNENEEEQEGENGGNENGGNGGNRNGDNGGNGNGGNGDEGNGNHGMNYG